jgi:hypothetical protein
MNALIQELAEQAGSTHKQNLGVYQFYADELEKFAELIIGHAVECVRDVLRDETSDLSYAAASQVQARIKEYFGTEQ